MKTNTRIILDLNGVIMGSPVDLVMKFCAAQVVRGKMNPFLFLGIMKKAKNNTGQMTSREMAYIDSFVATKYYDKIKFLPGAIETCRRLIGDYNGAVHVCTAGALSDVAARGLRNRLYENIGGFNEVYFIPPLGSKKDYYAYVSALYPDDNVIVVDDSLRHINSARDLGLDTRYINKRNGFRDLNAAFYGNTGR